MAVNLYTEPNDLISAQPPVFCDFADVTGDSRIDETGAICNGKKGVAGSHDIDDAITPSHHYFAPFASVSTSDAVNSTTCVSPAKYFHCAGRWGEIPLVPDQTRPSSSFEHQPIDRSGRHILAVAGIARDGLQPDRSTQFLRQDAGWDVTRSLAIGESGTGFRQLRLACQSTRFDRALDNLITANSHKSETKP